MYKRHIKVEETNQSRIVVISDLHGGLGLLEKLLLKVGLTPDDHLVILGDFLQRGYQNEETLEKMIQLSKRDKTYILSGNHEHYLCSLLEEQHLDRLDYHMNHIHYGCIIREWIRTSLIGYDGLPELQNMIKSLYKKDLSFLEALPYSLEIGSHLFVHGGINNTLENSTAWDLLSTPSFLYNGHAHPGMVIVGHWPVQNYKKDSLSGEIIIDYEKKIICIDGGYGVKSSGQINALVIDEIYQCYAIDALDQVTMKNDVIGVDGPIVKLDYDDKKFKVLTKQPNFSEAMKISTEETFLMINDYLNHDFDDYISHFISCEKGEVAGLVKSCKDYSLIKLNGHVGWMNNQNII